MVKEPKQYMADAILKHGLGGKPTAREQKLLVAALAALEAQAVDYLAVGQQLLKATNEAVLASSGIH